MYICMPLTYNSTSFLHTTQDLQAMTFWNNVQVQIKLFSMHKMGWLALLRTFFNSSLSKQVSI